MGKRKLSDREMQDCVQRIAEPSFKFIRKKIERELDYIYKNDSVPDINDIVNIMIMSLANTDTNILMMMRNIFKKITGSDMDFPLAMKLYIDDIMSILHKDEISRLKEKMN